MKDFLKFLIYGGIFLIPLLPLYVENDFFFPFITGKNFAFRIIVEVIFAAWVVLALLDKQYRPKFSWIMAGFSALVIIMFFANLLGEFPHKSFWSNFERMDGYVTLIHVFLLALIMGSTMHSEKLWKYFFYLSSAVALGVALYGLAQVTGAIDASGRGRLDSRLGNAAYMAVYMLFHIFILAWLSVRSRNHLVWLLSGITLLIYAYALLLTATRGTILAFIGGSVVSVAYIALFGRKFPEIRKYAIGGMIALVILILGFYGVRDSEFIQGNSALARIANIDVLRDLETRGVIWTMALEGVKDRPLLGWGQGNFNYVFNEKFEPVLWDKEAWFDRVHNLVLDWLIAGGILGFLAYVSIFIGILYYLFWLPFFKDDERLDVLERAVLMGLIVGYLLHNMVVFDNIISYIFFACILALIHFRVSEPIEFFEEIDLDPRLVNQIIAPVVLALGIGIVYFVNVPGILAAGDIIDAMRAGDLRSRLGAFHQALERGSFADQEIVEQLAQQAMNIVRNPNIPAEDKDLIVKRAELELLRMVEEKPGDARLHNFLSTFYRTIGAFPQAKEQAAIARSLSPRKPAIILEQGVIAIQMGDLPTAAGFFREAVDLAPENSQARVLLAATEIRLGEIEAANEVIGEAYLDQFVANDFAVESAYQSGDFELIERVFRRRAELVPNVAQNWASLSYVYYEHGDTEKSIEVLEDAKVNVPGFADTAQCFIDNIEAGNEPAEGCSQAQ